MSIIRPTHHIAIIGKKGTGKSTLARYIIEQEQKDSPWITSIWSNTSILTQEGNPHPKFHRIRYLKQLDHAKDGIVYIDELSKAIPSRKVGHQQTELYNLIQNVMNRLRKKNCYFIYTDQWRRGADIMIRTNVDYLFNPALTREDVNERHGDTPLFYFSYQPKGTEFWEMESPAEKGTLMHTDMMLKDIFPLFKTEEVIPLTYNSPFKVESWTKAFLLWTAKHSYNVKDMKGNYIRNVLDLYQIKKNAYISNREVSAVLGKLKVDGHI